MAADPTPAEPVHLVFGRSAADTLRQALPPGQRVIGLPGALSIGPIDPPDFGFRQAWAAATLGADPDLWHDIDGDPAASAAAWTEATVPHLAPILWACLSTPLEHACFLAFAAHMADHRPDHPFEFVDASSHGPLGALRAHQIAAAGLLATRRPLDAQERRTAAAAWADLRRQNAPFRIVQDGRLVSAPLTHYDARLIERATPDWDVAARLIGRTLEHIEPGENSGGDVLFARLRALARQNTLEGDGPDTDMRTLRIRHHPNPALDPTRK